jgi:hypothetical protein
MRRRLTRRTETSEALRYYFHRIDEQRRMPPEEEIDAAGILYVGESLSFGAVCCGGGRGRGPRLLGTATDEAITKRLGRALSRKKHKRPDVPIRRQAPTQSFDLRN